MYADQRHRAAFQHLFPDVRIIVWAPFDYPLSSLEVTHPRLYTQHPELPHRGNTWSIRGDPEPLPDWPTHPQQIHIRHNVAAHAHHTTVTAPAISSSDLNHFDLIQSLPEAALLSYRQLRTVLHSHELTLLPTSSLYPQPHVTDLEPSPLTTNTVTVPRPPGWPSPVSPPDPVPPTDSKWRRDPPD